MELPIAKQSYLPSPDAFVRAIKRADTILARTVAEETQLDAATVFTNPGRPAVDLANCAMDVRVPEGWTASRAVGEVLDHFRGLGLTCHFFQSVETGWPTGLGEELQRQGYGAIDPVNVLMLDHYAAPARMNGGLQIIPGRASYGQVREVVRSAAAIEWKEPAENARQIEEAQVDHLDEPRLESFLGRVEGRAAGVVNVLTLGQIGVIEWVYTVPAFRGQGVASRLVDHAVDYCKRALFEQVILESVPGSEAEAMLLKMGFKAVAGFAAYGRVGPSA